MPYAKKENVSIYYEISGERNKENIVLVSGLNTQMTCWDPSFIDMLVSRGFRVIAFDNRDCGKSTVVSKNEGKDKINSLAEFLQYPDKAKIEYSLWDMTDDLCFLLETLEISKAHIVGRSMGGILAQLFAFKYPAMTETLTLIMSSSFKPSLPKADDALIHKMTSESVQYRNDPKSFVQEKLDFLKLIYGSFYSIDREKERRLIISNEERKSDFIRPHRQIVALISYPYDVSVLNEIKSPSLIIHGDEDPLFGMESCHDLKNSISDAELVIKKGMGHAIPGELYNEIVEDIACFIEKSGYSKFSTRNSR